MESRAKQEANQKSEGFNNFEDFETNGSAGTAVHQIDQ